MTSTWKNLTPAAYNHITMQKGKNTLTYMNKELKFTFRFPAYFLEPELITKKQNNPSQSKLTQECQKEEENSNGSYIDNIFCGYWAQRNIFLLFFFFFKSTNFPSALITLQWKRSFTNQSTKYVFLIGFA